MSAIPIEERKEIPPPTAPEMSRFQRQLLITALCLVTLVAVVFLFERFALFLQQLLTAVFLAYITFPIYHGMRERGVPKILAVGLLVVIICGLGFFLGLAVQSGVRDLTAKLPSYRVKLVDAGVGMANMIPEVGPSIAKDLRAWEGTQFERGLVVFQEALSTLVTFTSHSFIVFVYMLFLLAEHHSLVRRLRVACDADRCEYFMTMIGQINRSISTYIVLKTVLSIVVGVATAVILLCFGIDYAILWGILTFLLNYIPYLGSIGATILPALLALVQYDNPAVALGVLTGLTIVHIAVGYVLEPIMAGSRLDLSPLVVILALAFWGSLWGIIGMILAIPLVVTIKIILENIPATRPFAVLMANPGEAPARVSPVPTGALLRTPGY